MTESDLSNIINSNINDEFGLKWKYLLYLQGNRQACFKMIYAEHWVIYSLASAAMDTMTVNMPLSGTSVPVLLKYIIRSVNHVITTPLSRTSVSVLLKYINRSVNHVITTPLFGTSLSVLLKYINKSVNYAVTKALPGTSAPVFTEHKSRNVNHAVSTTLLEHQYPLN